MAQAGEGGLAAEQFEGVADAGADGGAGHGDAQGLGDLRHRFIPRQCRLGTRYALVDKPPVAPGARWYVRGAGCKRGPYRDQPGTSKGTQPQHKH